MKKNFFLLLCLPLFLAVGCGDSAKEKREANIEKLRQMSSIDGITVNVSDNTGADEDERLQKVCSDQKNLERLKNRGEMFPAYKELYDRCIKFLEEHKTSETAAK